METMRTNQRIIARSLANSVDSTSRLDTRDLKRALGVVPFRHSKLTEILMDYFVGEGRVASIAKLLSMQDLELNDLILPGHDCQCQPIRHRV